jgi:diguanylate cyclase (GGDEF)-like protein
MSVELVSAFAGDREMTATEKDLIRKQKDTRGRIFFSDLLYAISHQHFSPDIAATLWDQILSHKQLISQRLGRNTRIVVAALDYLTNITADLKAATLISEARASEIANLAMRDDMTGLFNHSSSYELLGLDLRNHRRYAVSVSLIMLDIDDFKSVNDRGGHPEGDRVLVDLAQTLIEQTRDSDICCRIGGDEFLVILRNADMDETLAVAERIRGKVTTIASSGQQISVSVGIALCDLATTSPRALMQIADRALYEAKGGGKNQIVLGVPALSAQGLPGELEGVDSAGPSSRAPRPTMAPSSIVAGETPRRESLPNRQSKRDWDRESTTGQMIP